MKILSWFKLKSLLLISFFLLLYGFWMQLISKIVRLRYYQLFWSVFLDWVGNLRIILTLIVWMCRLIFSLVTFWSLVNGRLWNFFLIQIVVFIMGLILLLRAIVFLLFGVVIVSILLHVLIGWVLILAFVTLLVLLGQIVIAFIIILTVLTDSNWMVILTLII